jgi:hypothetical protein
MRLQAQAAQAASQAPVNGQWLDGSPESIVHFMARRVVIIV